MEQEQTLFQLKNIGKGTGEILLKGILAFFEQSSDSGKNIGELLSKSGEVNWNRFMANDATKEIKRFRTSEVNLEKLKEYLKPYGVRFSVKKLSEDEIALAFEAKNKDIVRDAFEHLIADVVDPQKDPKTQEVINRLVKNPNAKSFEERLEKAKAETAQEIAEKKAKAKEAREAKKAEKEGKVPEKNIIEEEMIRE
ncbi:DUF3801 domain-containing protein [Streptococcus iniae]|uniref:DUF3801 domain-containing protein n=1 Tax=Streptococcus agalactiae TaxID=1311 RepID=UPI0008D9BB90|nr:DUF3801 domain-containing protein [Streptococcus agalactiae]ELY5747376.1 hypothetical protein [Streptococcus iniae]KAF0052061.1 hypothetical protein GL192_00845 [Streptococcus agalactiae]OHX26186.1 hypothetical protein BKX95_11815 [Streptococcus iniae]